jgi:hypothetical protein
MTDEIASRLARRNHGSFFILNEDLEITAHPYSFQTRVSDDPEQLVALAARTWSKSSTDSELRMMLYPWLSARVYPLQGPDRSCIVVHLERILAESRDNVDRVHPRQADTITVADMEQLFQPPTGSVPP